MPKEKSKKGMKYSQFLISGFPKKITISSSKNHIRMVAIKNINAPTNMDKNTICLASSSDFGDIIANSYRPVAIEDKIEKKAKNNAARPKSSGV